MSKIVIKSYGKINLSIDVLGRLESGYHEVEMVMQQIARYDLVDIKWIPDQAGNGDDMGADKTAKCAGSENGKQIEKRIKISLSTNRSYLPCDERNLAYKAAMIMSEHYGQGRSGRIVLNIKKVLPVAAGLAGGSGNGAAVLLGLNRLWKLKLDVKTLCELGSELGADVPFCIMGQAKCNKNLGSNINKDSMAACCALATGIGTELKPVDGKLESYIVLAKPPISVSTPEIYNAFDDEEITEHPDTEALLAALGEKELPNTEKNKIVQKKMFNILEKVTYKRYPIVVYTKNKFGRYLDEEKILMSGSGPTLFALVETKEEAMEICRRLKKEVKEVFWTRTTV